MKFVVKLFTLTLLFVYSQPLFSLPIKQAKEIISIAAIDWCPQICPKEERNGYILDIVKQTFKDSKYQLDVQYYPWSRAIKMVKEGKVDGLLSPAKAEAPSLIYPENEVGIQKMCFFTLANSKWQYTGLNSLKDQQIGVSKDASIEELNSYLALHPEQFQSQPYVDRFIEQNVKKLLKKRIDSFLFTYNTTKFELTRLKLWDKVREAGCVSLAKVYLAFSPKIKNSRMNQIISVFNKHNEQVYLNNNLASIMANYELKNWR